MLWHKYGPYPVEIKAFDRAGNSVLSEIDIKIDPIRAPLIKEVAKEVKRGQSLIVKGTAEPGSEVVVQAVRNNAEFIHFVPEATAQLATIIDDDHFTTTTTTTDSGDWLAEMNGLPAGKYKVFALTKDDRLAMSEPQGGTETVVRGGVLDFVFKIFDYIVNMLSRGGLFIAFLVVLVGLILSLIKLLEKGFHKWWHEFSQERQIKSDIGKSSKKLDHIVHDMADELKFLESISRRRRLGPEEKYLKAKIEQYLKAIKVLTNKR